MTDDEKMARFGEMVFGLITDVLIMPTEAEAYVRKTVTTPDGKGGKHSFAVIVARHGVADVMEKAARAHYDCLEFKASSKQ